MNKYAIFGIGAVAGFALSQLTVTLPLYFKLKKEQRMKEELIAEIEAMDEEEKDVSSPTEEGEPCAPAEAIETMTTIISQEGYTDGEEEKGEETMNVMGLPELMDLEKIDATLAAELMDSETTNMCTWFYDIDTDVITDEDDKEVDFYFGDTVSKQVHSVPEEELDTWAYMYSRSREMLVEMNFV